MELFGIIFSVPVIFISSIIYSFIIKKVTDKYGLLRKPLLLISALIFVLVFLEFIGVITFGVIKFHEYIGAYFYSIHTVFFFLAVPALVNIMQLQKKYPFLSVWHIIGVFCAIYGLGVVLLQYTVSEALFGIDGIGGLNKEP